jgi:hypothetical protein
VVDRREVEGERGVHRTGRWEGASRRSGEAEGGRVEARGVGGGGGVG